MTTRTSTRRTLWTLAAVATLGSSAPAALRAQPPVSGTVQLNALSQYFFAGIPFAGGAVTQASASVATSSGLTLNAFTVYDYDASSITEFDVYGDVYRQLTPGLGLFVGAALYNFDLGPAWEATPEVYGGLVLTAPLNPVLYVAHDFDLGDGTHVTLTLSDSRPLGDSGATLELVGNVDYNRNYYTVDFSGLSFADIGASVGIPAGPVTITPSALLMFALDDTFQTQAGIEDLEEVFGIAASWSF